MKSLFFLTFLLGLLYGINCFADPQWAIVMNSKAVIYADPYRTSPIGFVPKGKKFKVGNVPRNDGSMLPLIVSGRIAYIALDDISVAHDQFLLELPSERYVKTKSRRKLYEKDVSFNLHNFSSNLKSGQYDANEEEKNTASFMGLTVQGMVNIQPDWALGTSFSYEMASEGSQSLSALFINLDSVYKFFNRYTYYLGHIVSVGFSPYSRLSVDDKFKLTGQALQAGTGFEFGYLFGDTAFKIGTSYKLQAYTNFNVPSGLEEFRPAIHGVMFYTGLAFNY